MVLEKLRPHLNNSSIPAILQLSTALRYLASGAFQGVIGKKFFLVSLSPYRFVKILQLKMLILVSGEVLCLH